MEESFNEDALRRARVRVSREEAALLARSLRGVVRRDLLTARERGEGGPSLDTLLTVEAAALALEGETFLEVARRSAEAWTGDAERDALRAEEAQWREREEARRGLDEAGVERRRLAEGVIRGVREGRTEFSAEEVEMMKAMMARRYYRSSDERTERFLRENERSGEGN